MYVCICHAVREHDIERSVASGAASFEEVQKQLQISTGCGACRVEADRCYRRFALSKHLASFSPAEEFA